jgi:hypothetical protein
MDEYTTATELNQLAGVGAASWIALDAGGLSVKGQNRSSKYPITPSKRKWISRSPANIGTPARVMILSMFHTQCAGAAEMIEPCRRVIHDKT